MPRVLDISNSRPQSGSQPIGPCHLPVKQDLNSQLLAEENEEVLLRDESQTLL